jgi:hypothetical protein
LFTKYLFLFVGGKFIEWTSCLIVLPYLYASAAYKLVQLQIDVPSAYAASRPQSEAEAYSKTNDYNSGVNGSGRSLLESAEHLQADVEGYDSDEYSSSPVIRSADNSSSTTRKAVVFSAKFSAFYAKMAAVPALFLFARFWGSLRVILNVAADKTTDGEDSYIWLSLMQDAFDPAQGFFNAIIFVVCSTEGLDSIREALTALCSGCKGGKTASLAKTSFASPNELSRHITGQDDEYYEGLLAKPVANHPQQIQSITNFTNNTNFPDARIGGRFCKSLNDNADTRSYQHPKVVVKDTRIPPQEQKHGLQENNSEGDDAHLSMGFFDREDVYEDEYDADLVPVTGSCSATSYFASLKDALEEGKY